MDLVLVNNCVAVISLVSSCVGKFACDVIKGTGDCEDIGEDVEVISTWPGWADGGCVEVVAGSSVTT